MTLLRTQQRMAAALMMPLGSSGSSAIRTKRAALLRREAVGLIKPNDRLSSVERLKIYRQSYWARVTGALTEDFPGLQAVLGTRAFNRLTAAYLTDCPSRSFTLRNLGSGLEGWLREHPQYAGANKVLALEMASLEWAHIVAFDGPQEKVPGTEDLLDLNPALRLGVQPYISLLEVHYPVGELRIKVNGGQEHQGLEVASNFATKSKRPEFRIPSRSQPERIFLAVHRLELTVYYRRLSPEEFRLLQALRSGRTIAGAIRAAFHGSSVSAVDAPELLRTWFSMWAEFGWLCAWPTRR